MGRETLIYILRCRSPRVEWAQAEEVLRARGLTPDEREILFEDLAELRSAIEHRGRDLAVLEDAEGNRYYATGGATWGDAPTPLFEAIERLARYPNVFLAAGLELIV